MQKRMLIDGAHQEELRIIVTENDQITEFDYQSIHKESTKGNIYLAKVTRVEPSLQAAFVDYGTDRHGFLPFAEIHPDYYQIPIADREQLIAEMRNESAANLEDESDDIESFESSKFSAYKRYKIQEVIKKDQVVLIQIDKEERGNKGASATTYISIAGRYCVLMPNATKAGGVSRKISDDEDRRRLKKVAVDLTEELNGKGSVIIRTAGAYKTKTEIKKDLGYLGKMWEKIIAHTVKSKAPAFIHKEGDMVIKSIRDLYDADVSEILIAGVEVYEQARNFMKAILPRHVNKVKLHNQAEPLFAKYDLEEQIAQLYSPIVSLPSGGYLVINQTEALVAIDVNSGKSTSERNVENTAVKTNLEAAYEVSRQARLRDLAGLIVVDFIDMQELKNKKAVENAIKDAVAQDKAKIHLGRISQFGLLEMSRQRLRPSLNEANSNICQHCNGRGRIRSIEATVIAILRAIKSELAPNDAELLEVSASSEVVLNILNHKRRELIELEKEFNANISLYIDETAGGDGFFMEKHATKQVGKAQNAKLHKNAVALSDMEDSMETNNNDSISDNQQADEDTSKSKFKFKKKQGVRKPKQPFVQETVSSVTEATDVDVQTKSRNNKRKRPKGKFFTKDRANEEAMSFDGNVMHEDSEASNFDEEMAKRRQQNKGLLKEIWKKIVD